MGGSPFPWLPSAVLVVCRSYYRFIQRRWFHLLLPIETSCPASAGSSHNLVAFRHAMDTLLQRHHEAWYRSVLAIAGPASLELRPSCSCDSYPWLSYLPASSRESLELPRADLRPCSHLSFWCFGGSESVLEERPALALGSHFLLSLLGGVN